MLNESTDYVAIENILLHTGLVQLLNKGSKEGQMFALMQPCEGVQQGNPLLTDREQLLMISDSLLMLAHLIPAIVVPVCVTTMVGLS